jgi:hypothetical protein
MSTLIRYVLTDTAPAPAAFAEQIHRFTHAQAFADPWRLEHTHGAVHVLTTAAIADEAAAFFLDKIGIPYEVRGETTA